MHHPTALLLLVVVAATVVHGHAAAGTPAALFWEQSLPDSPMPTAVADLVQKGIDHSPLLEHYSALPSISSCVLVDNICSPRTVAETGLFFRQTQLRPGAIMTVSFPSAADEPAILPHDVAEKTPFTNLDDVLATFHISPGSAAAAQVSDTLHRCQEPPLAGEVKSCTTSLEATVRSAVDDMLGGAGAGAGDGVVRAVASQLPRGGLPRRPYVVQAVTRVHGDLYVACHKMPFPYAVYQCHMTKLGYEAHVVSLREIQGDAAADMLAYCHMDTSSWNPAHPAFEVLHTSPGGSPVCHFMPYADLGFVKNINRA
ncbi:hypothetical protein EJB05_51640, partial [Eragrostis curvula]